MIVTVPAPDSIDPALLRDELTAAGFPPVSAERKGSRLAVTFDEGVDPVSVQQIVEAHVPSEIAQLDQLVTKARAVWGGTDTFTAAQVQKILAGLVLLEAKRR